MLLDVVSGYSSKSKIGVHKLSGTQRNIILCTYTIPTKVKASNTPCKSRHMTEALLQKDGREGRNFYRSKCKYTPSHSARAGITLGRYLDLNKSLQRKHRS